MVCVVGRMRDLILQLSKSSIYSTKPPGAYLRHLHHSDGSSSQGKFNLSDLFCARNGFRTRS
ncbi:TPA: hypothetical protein MHK94_20510 [Klebsiella pneumoniae]|nr:hypothetical protein C1163_01100 [Klebsiella pneumoniae]HBX4391479.1 hypothetical protein [Klebsiella pneumoniae]HBX7117117.1 hypothetical protein [Klebsiella pneumoniae]HBX7289555.1 hypothetical protein [Klebsiella pneumoniae]HBX7308074.1 hypothetical protein [Klebsiella pneumoniae]